MRDDRIGLDRILAFGDAVVAIAITLLALPLVDAALDAKTATAFFHDHAFALAAAAISFSSISASWRSNHAVFRRATGYTEFVITLGMIWLASIVALPIATALLVGGRSTDRLSLIVYLGVITVTAGLTRVQHEVLARRGLLDGPAETTLERVNGWLPVVLRLLAMLGSALLPQFGLWTLIVLAPGQVFSWAVRLSRRRRQAGTAPRS